MIELCCSVHFTSVNYTPRLYRKVIRQIRLDHESAAINLKNAKMHPPDIIGSVKLSSREPRSKNGGQSKSKKYLTKYVPRASATPLTSPATMPIAPSPSQPLAAPTTELSIPSQFRSDDVRGTPFCHVHDKLAPLCLSGAIQPQNITATQAPVADAAMNPAMDFLGAKGSRRRGNRRGKEGVRCPNIRPNVDAAVSAHDKLKQRSE
jgi:hypothetical protein